MKQKIIDKLVAQFNPTNLEVRDQSHMHANHNTEAKLGGTHFEISISSKKFSTLTRIESHKMIYACLQKELSEGVHALAIKIID